MNKFQIILSNIIITSTIVAAVFYLSHENSFKINNANIVKSRVDTVVIKSKETNQVAIKKSRETIITHTVKNVSPAVVGISVKELRQYQYSSPFNNHPFWGQFLGNQIFNKEISGLGSGAIISSDPSVETGAADDSAA